MRSGPKPQDLPPAVTHDQQSIEQSERDCRHDEMSIAAMPSAWLRRNVFHPCEGGPLLRGIYLATLVWPDIDAELEKLSMDSRRSPQWAGDAHLADQPANLQRYGGRPQRCRDFQRQYDLKPARCQRITVSGRTIASVSYVLGNSWQTPPNISLSIDPNGSLLGLPRHSTLICCLSTRISASSVARDHSRSITAPKISLHKSNIEQQHRPILDQPPADWIYDRDRNICSRAPPAVVISLLSGVLNRRPLHAD
jgi:hypothetical protein